MSDRMQNVVGVAFLLFVLLPTALLFTSWWPVGVGIFVFDVLVAIPVTIRIIAKSLDTIGPEEVALMSHSGKLDETKVYKPGRVFVLWIPLYELLYGRPYRELVRFPTKLMIGDVKGGAAQKIWSSEGVALYVNFGWNIILPHLEPVSLALIIRSQVPLEENALNRRVEMELTSGLRDVMADIPSEEAIKRSKLTEINDRMKLFLEKPNGWFARSGICGNDPTSFDPGTGEVVIRIDLIELPPEITKARQDIVTVGYETQAAEKRIELAEKERQIAAMQASVAETAYNDWLATPAGIAATDEQKASAREGFRQKALADIGKFSESAVALKGPGNTPLPNGLTTLVIGDSNTGLMIGGGGGKRRKKTGSKKDKDDGGMPDDDYESVDEEDEE